MAHNFWTISGFLWIFIGILMLLLTNDIKSLIPMIVPIPVIIIAYIKTENSEEHR